MTKKVTLMISNRWYSAITGYALAFATMLLKKGVSVQVIALKNKPAAKRSEKLGVTVCAVESFSLRWYASIRNLIQGFDPDWVVTFGGPESFLLGLIKNFDKRKWLDARFLGSELPPRSLLKKFFFGLRLQKHALVIVPCTKIEKEIVKLKVRVPIKMIPLGIDEEVFCFNAIDPREYVFQPKVTIVGRLDPVKGHRLSFYYFAQMLRIWDKNIPRPRLVVVGEAANLSGEQLRKWAKEQGLKDPEDVEFHFYRYDNLPSLMSQSALGWVPSLGSEIIGRVAEEFLMCGTRICTSGVGGLGDLASDINGENYEKIKDDEIPRFLQKEILKGMADSVETKKNRSVLAQKTFGYNSISELLLDALNG